MLLLPMTAPPQSMPSVSFSISLKMASTLWIEHKGDYRVAPPYSRLQPLLHYSRSPPDFASSYSRSVVLVDGSSLSYLHLLRVLLSLDVAFHLLGNSEGISDWMMQPLFAAMAVLDPLLTILLDQLGSIGDANKPISRLSETDPDGFTWKLNFFTDRYGKVKVREDAHLIEDGGLGTEYDAGSGYMDSTHIDYRCTVIGVEKFGRLQIAENVIGYNYILQVGFGWCTLQYRINLKIGILMMVETILELILQKHISQKSWIKENFRKGRCVGVRSGWGFSRAAGLKGEGITADKGSCAACCMGIGMPNVHSKGFADGA
ncbi:hypothetical protein LXL04_005646 [Taraxacum kok-saghyz]